MKILLVNIDSKLPNIALHKIAKHYEEQGHEIIWDMPIARYMADKIYVSCIFTKNRHLCEEWEDEAEIGGTGYDIKKKLPEDIERMKPKINYGFTTRGCIRKCKFCFVPEKEGGIRVTGDIHDIWDGKSKEIIILDNNILAVPDHFKMICGQIRENKLTVDFNQGLDIRLLTDGLAREIKKTKLKEIRFAYDNPGDRKIIEKKIPILRKYNMRAMFYVLAGYNSTIEEEIDRVNYLTANRQRAYIMRHENSHGDKRYIALAQWVNSPIFGKGTIPFSYFLNNMPKGKQYRQYFIDTP